MKKVFIIIAFVAIIAFLAFTFIGTGEPNVEQPIASNLDLNTAEDLINFVDKMYEENKNLYGSLMTQAVDVADNALVSSFTGLKDAKDVQFCIVSEPMMSSQAYSLVLVKVKEGVDVEKIAKTMNENINMRKWICVEAEKAYTTSSGDIVCLVMSSESMAKPVYTKFMELAGAIGQEYERSAEPIVLEDDMLQPDDVVVE